MLLKKLVIKNACQHESLEWEFGTGLIGIFGPNGSGKSNAMNICAYSCLTNDYSRHYGGKAGLIRQQSEAGTQSGIFAVFEHNGMQLEISRGLRSPVLHKLEAYNADRSSVQIWEKAPEIQTALQGILGVDRRLIDNFIFVSQWELFAFLSDTAADRAKAFAHLCNTVHIERCWEELGETIKTDIELTLSVVDNRDEIRSHTGQLKKDLKQQQGEIEIYRGKILPDGEQDALEKRARHITAYLMSKQDLVGDALQKELSTEKLAEADKAVKAWSMKLHQLEAKTNAARADVDHVREKRRDLAEKTDTQCSMADLRDAYVAEKKRCIELEEKMPIVVLDEDVEKLLKKISGVEFQLKGEQAILDNLDGDVTACPTCGTPTENLEALIAEAKEMLPQRTKELLELSEELNRQRFSKKDYDRKVGELRLSAARRDEKKEALVEADMFSEEAFKMMGEYLEELGDFYHKLEKEFKICQQILTEQDGKLSPARNNYNKSIQVQAKHKALLATASSQIAQHESSMAAHYEEGNLEQFDDIHQGLVDDILLQVKEDRKYESEVSAQEKIIVHIERSIKEREKALEQVTARLEESKRAQEWVDVLTDLRDEVMHRDKLPKLAHHRVIRMMEAKINETLEMFQSPFQIKATEDISFVAYFANGAVTPAEGLSGGQKVMLAMAYRLTANSMFASQIGMMVLDEPTDGLDSDNRALAAEVFQRMGVIAQSQGQQVIVITHDELLERVFDQKFTLTAA